MAENSLWAKEINGDDDEDEALRLAIAMSLGEEVPQKKNATAAAQVIDLTQQDDIETASEPSNPGSPVSHPRETKDEQPVARLMAPTSSLSLLGLDRKKMEEERLARLGKRKAPDGDALEDTARPSQRLKMSTTAPAQVHQTRHNAQPAIKPAQLVSHLSSSQQVDPKPPFPRGTVRKTWCAGQPRLGDDIKIEEVLQKDQLELAVISSFQWDPDFLIKKIDLGKTKICLIASAPDEAEQDAIRASLPSSRARFCFPPMNGPGAMHSKLMILKFATYLRIVVPTGNLVPYDWGETGVMENMVFLIDLPRIQNEAGRVASKLTAFGEDLCYFLQAQGVEDGLIRSLVKYDFAQTERYGFVHSIAGSHAEESWRRTGYCGLGRSVDQLGLSTKETIDVDIVCSSMGAINYDLLRMVYGACQGDDGMREFAHRAAKKTPESVTQSLDLLRAHVRVYFPSQVTVENSLGGKDNAGTIFFMSKWWNQTTFPKAVLRDCKSERRGVLMHNKVIYVRHHHETSLDPTAVTGFAYVGSANLSESAWGKLVKDRASGKPKMTCRNWECGVVVPLEPSPLGIRTGADSPDWRWVFRGRIPIPMQVPGDLYCGEATEESQSSRQRRKVQPWCQR